MSLPHLTQDQKERIQEILETLDRAPISPDVINRRKARRLHLRTSVTAHLLSLPGHPQISLHTRNISTSGMGFVGRRPFARGEQIAIELFMVPRLEKLILGVVTFSRYVRDGLYEVGCNFTEALPRDEAEVRYAKEHIPDRWIQAALPHHGHLKAQPTATK